MNNVLLTIETWFTIGTIFGYLGVMIALIAAVRIYNRRKARLQALKPANDIHANETLEEGIKRHHKYLRDNTARVSCLLHNIKHRKE